MTVDVGELERLIGACDKPGGSQTEAEAWLRLGAYLRAHAPAMAARLKAAEEMREALKLYASPYGQKGDDGWLVNVPDFYDELDFGDRAQRALAAYDAASRPISATGEVVNTGSMPDGATS